MDIPSFFPLRKKEGIHFSFLQVAGDSEMINTFTEYRFQKFFTMRKILQLIFSFGMSIITGLTALAVAPPVLTTTIDNGHFAVTTHWYTLQIGSSGSFISLPTAEGYIPLSRPVTTLSDEDLWCFVGDETSGYAIYNKAAGSAMVLGAPKNMSGNNGGSSFVKLIDATTIPTSYGYKWAFDASDKLGAKTPSFFMYLVGYAGNKINDRDGKLAFWTKGADAGSSVQIRFAAVDMPVTVKGGTLAGTGGSRFKTTWTSTATDPQLVLDAGANNMLASGEQLLAYVGQVKPRTYTLRTNAGYAVRDYTFKFKNETSGAKITLETGDHQKFTASNDFQQVTFKGGKTNQAIFILNGDNKGLLLNDFVVTVTRALIPEEPQQNLFVYNNTTKVTYRIPALGVSGKTGTLVAISDSRHTGTGDIGTGRIDLFLSRSTDNGKTWTTPDVLRDAEGKPVAQGTGKLRNNDVNQSRDAGYGDAAIVGDYDSDSLLVMSVSGFTPFFKGRRNKPNAVARWYSPDAGKTWTKAEDITESIYSLFDNNSPRGKIESMFFGSGRIFQSHRTKVGQHYRLYAVLTGLNVEPQNTAAWVLYSDDFGHNWKILGNPMTPPVPSGGDEPKAEELPDGSILVSARTGGGRNFNIYTFTDVAKGEGQWGDKVFSPLVKASSNACNGEILIVPVKKRATGEKMYLALQSVPFGPSNRSNVGINYKPLTGYQDFGTVAGFAKDWEGSHQASNRGSAYSTMIWQRDNRLGFLMEEETFRNSSQGGYTIVYKNYSIEQITDSTYTYYPDPEHVVADSLRTLLVKARVAALPAEGGKNVGEYTVAGLTTIKSAAAAYEATPSGTTYEAFNTALFDAGKVALNTNILYYLRNEGYKTATETFYLKAAGTRFTGVADFDEQNSAFLFSFIPSAIPGQYYIYSETLKRYLPKFGADNITPPLSTTKLNAGLFTLITRTNGRTSILCQNGNGPHNAVHLNRSKQLVPWNIDSEPSYWVLMPSEKPSTVTAPRKKGVHAAQWYELTGRPATRTAGGILINDRGEKILR